MYVIVVGAGKVGYHLTRTLIAEGHEVTLTEKNPARVAELTAEFGETLVVGDGCEVRVMQDVGMSRADCVVAVTGHDEDNLVVCQIAKHRFKVPRVLARVYDPIRAEVFRDSGIETICSTLLGAGVFHDLLLERPLLNAAEYFLPRNGQPPAAG